MKAEVVLHSLEKRGVRLTSDGNTLRVEGKGASLTAEEKDAIRLCKPELLQRLRPEGRKEVEIPTAPPQPVPELPSSVMLAKTLLAPYAPLIAQADRRCLRRGSLIRLSSWEDSEDLNRTVLQAVAAFRYGMAQLELLERCRLAQNDTDTSS